MSNPPQIKRCKACDGTGYFMTEEELSAPETILFPVGGPADECKVCDGTGYVDAPGASTLPSADRPCTCHPDDNPPSPCARKYALSACRAWAEANPSPREFHSTLPSTEFKSGDQRS